MAKIEPSSPHLQIPRRERRNVRANDMVHDVAHKYAHLKKNLDESQSQTVDITCCIGGNHYPVKHLSPYSEECVYIITDECDDTFNAIFCPLEEVSFFITVSKRTDENPPREIGFHANPLEN